MNDIHIDLDKVPEIQKEKLFSTILDAVEAYYKDPKNIEAFEKWKKQKEATT